MIVDLPEPRNVEISNVHVRSRNPIKKQIIDVASDLVSCMRGDNDRDRDNRADRSPDLDDTRSRLPVPNNDSEFRANDRRVQIPQWLLLFLILQGGGIIWWAATMQSDQRYQEREKVRLESKIDTEVTSLKQEIKLYEIQRQKDVDRVRDQVRDEVANQLLSRGVIRVQPSVP